MYYFSMAKSKWRKNNKNKHYWLYSGDVEHGYLVNRMSKQKELNMIGLEYQVGASGGVNNESAHH